MDAVALPSDDRPPMAVAMQWVSRITTVCLTMSLPAGLGYWLDQKFQTDPWLVSCGAVIGFAVGLIQLLQIVKAAEKSGNKRDRNTGP